MSEIKFKEIIVSIFVCAWAAGSIFSPGGQILRNIPYYKIALQNSPDHFQSMQYAFNKQSQDYYSILTLCDNLVPLTEKIQIILPKDNTREHAFLREKGRYFLYPKNYGDNDLSADYILVYGVNDYKIPEQYLKTAVFSADKYLLVKKGHPILLLTFSLLKALRLSI